jgi:hypothetical protein
MIICYLKLPLKINKATEKMSIVYKEMIFLTNINYFEV